MKDDLELVLEVTGPYLDSYLASGKSSLTPEQAKLLAVWILDSEVNNGGYDQYLWNTGGDLVAEVIEGLENIGADELANLTTAAIAELPDNYFMTSREERRKQLDLLQESPSSRLNSCDAQYYKSTDDPIRLLAEYIREYGLG